MATKIESILFEKDMSQGDLKRKIFELHGHDIGRDRISRICCGKLKNYRLNTAVMISDALGVSIDDIAEFPRIKSKPK